jgi:hypothetical protein
MTPKFFHRWIKKWIKDSGIAGDRLMTKNVNLGLSRATSRRTVILAQILVHRIESASLAR